MFSLYQVLLTLGVFIFFITKGDDLYTFGFATFCALIFSTIHYISQTGNPEQDKAEA